MARTCTDHRRPEAVGRIGLDCYNHWFAWKTGLEAELPSSCNDRHVYKLIGAMDCARPSTGKHTQESSLRSPHR